MRNDLGIYHLFGENKKVKHLFYNWCKGNDEFCEWDIENIENDLYIPCVNTSEKYIYFSHGNILDFLEEQGYYIGLPLRGKFKFVTCCYFKCEKSTRVGAPFYNNSGITGRTKALEIGIMKCLSHLEEKLWKNS